MDHPNFLHPQVKRHLTVRASERIDFRSFVYNKLFLKLRRGVFKKIIITISITFVLFLIFFGYSIGDAIYRLYKIYPLLKNAKSSAYNADLESLHSNLKKTKSHLARLSSDTQNLSHLSFLPIIGREIKSLNYTAQGSVKILGAVLPPLNYLNSAKGSLHELPTEHRVKLINHFAQKADDIQTGTQLLRKSRSRFTPQEFRQAVVLVDKIVELSPEMPKLLGVNKPARYLVIFANNLEIRPGGGFVGSYAILTLENGELSGFDVRDSYGLPGSFNPSLGPPAPIVMQKYLGIQGLPFRDSNWSPHYPTSAEALKAAYIREGGEYGNQIQGVITVTTEVLKEMMTITGSVKVGDIVFTSDNVIQELQKQVEITFWDQDISWFDRKDIMGDLAWSLRERLEDFTLNQDLQMLGKLSKLGAKKHIVLNFENQKVQKLVSDFNWAGSIPKYNSDTLMIVDANLGGFKTEALMRKFYSYSVTEDNGKLLANLSIRYTHTGRQSTPLINNYRTYVKVYVPKGARLVSASGNTSPVETNIEIERIVFSNFLIVPISEQKTLSFTYELPKYISQNNYSLQVLKQMGTYPTDLLINADFGNVKEEISDVLDTDKIYNFN